MPGPERGTAVPRNPDHYCTASNDDNDDGRCHNYALRGLDVCRSHGGSTPGSKAVAARHTVGEIAERQGIALPDVKPKDFQRVVAEIVAWNRHQFIELGTELESLRLIHSPVEHARFYTDILDRMDQVGRTLAALTKAAAALPVPPEEPPQPPPAERIAEALRGIRERMNAGPNCPNCKQPWPVGGAVVAEPEDDGVPVAEVLPFGPSD